MTGRDRHPGMTRADRAAALRSITSSSVACSEPPRCPSCRQTTLAFHMQRNCVLSDAGLSVPCRQRGWAVRGRILEGGWVSKRSASLSPRCGSQKTEWPPSQVPVRTGSRQTERAAAQEKRRNPHSIFFQRPPETERSEGEGIRMERRRTGRNPASGKHRDARQPSGHGRIAVTTRSVRGLIELVCGSDGSTLL